MQHCHFGVNDKRIFTVKMEHCGIQRSIVKADALDFHGGDDDAEHDDADALMSLRTG
jgi:hypothetical protein